MKALKLILDEEEELEYNLGLLRLSEKIPDYEFIFQLNLINPFKFRRVEDLKLAGNYFDFFFPVYEAYSKDKKTCIQIISNKNSESIQKKEITELFSDEKNEKILLNLYQEVDFIIKTSEISHDFSLILLPENRTFPIQSFSMNAQHELYPLLQVYE